MASNSENGLTCDVCARTFTHRGHFNLHLRSHTGERPYACDHPGCTRSFLRMDHLRRHEAIHETASQEKKSFKCPRPQCDKEFRLKEHLQRHINLHDRPTPYKCTICSASFAKKRLLGEHHALEHNGQMPYKCTEAGCTSAFARPGHLQRHIISVHVEKTYVCMDEACVDLPPFSKFSHLQRHLRRDHRQTTFKCNQCEKNFTRAHDLRNHQQLHEAQTVDRPIFHCPFPDCSLFYTSKSNLGTHIRSKHTEQDAFLCELCSQTFSLKSTLKRHILKVHLPKETANSSKPTSGEGSSCSIEPSQLEGQKEVDDLPVEPPSKKFRANSSSPVQVTDALPTQE